MQSLKFQRVALYCKRSCQEVIKVQEVVGSALVRDATIALQK